MIFEFYFVQSCPSSPQNNLAELRSSAENNLRIADKVNYSNHERKKTKKNKIDSNIILYRSISFVVNWLLRVTQNLKKHRKLM